MLTLKKLKAMKPDTIFGSAEGLIEHPWFNNATKVSEDGALEEDGRSTKVRWVAIRGGYHDWAIYHSMDANICPHDYFNDQCHLSASIETIARSGAKLHNRDKIKEFVDCDEESLKMYRD